MCLDNVHYGTKSTQLLGDITMIKRWIMTFLLTLTFIIAPIYSESALSWGSGQNMSTEYRADRPPTPWPVPTPEPSDCCPSGTTAGNDRLSPDGPETLGDP